jgi:hypothetical protein
MRCIRKRLARAHLREIRIASAPLTRCGRAREGKQQGHRADARDCGGPWRDPRCSSSPASAVVAVTPLLVVLIATRGVLRGARLHLIGRLEQLVQLPPVQKHPTALPADVDHHSAPFDGLHRPVTRRVSELAFSHLGGPRCPCRGPGSVPPRVTRPFGPKVSSGWPSGRNRINPTWNVVGLVR